ncbi:MAG: hypothetical protein CBE11_01255 [Rickettsiales bacterium TMED251]|nr:MAG: hypothetical protein CBE11_01255 [Rickettsiales bacterium TMED251]|tara:strand:+ start:1491 stop:1757 length:267 start_codon:yes stop_codon:yes gene_type:complete
MRTKEKSDTNLHTEIATLNKKKFFQIYESIWKMLFFSFIKGLASGLGWVIGATILVSILTFLLSKFEFIPILGELISEIILEIKSFDR